MSDKTPLSKETYIQLRRQADKVIRRAKKHSWKLLGEELNSDMKGSKKKIYKLASSLRKPRDYRNIFKNERGELTSDPNEINKTWTNYSLSNFSMSKAQRRSSQRGKSPGNHQYTMRTKLKT